MLRSPGCPDNDADEASWRDVERLLDETAQFALRAPSVAEFQAVWLSRAVQVLSGQGGALWKLDGPRQLTLVTSDGVLGEWIKYADFNERHHAALLEQWDRSACQPSELALHPPAGAASLESLVSILVPLGDEREIYGLVEVAVLDEPSQSLRRSRANVLAAFAEIATDYFRQQRVGELRGELRQWESWTDWMLQVHGRQDLRSTCYALVEAWQQAIPSDRVTVLVRKGARLRVAAISGVSEFDARSSAVRELERLASMLADDESPVWYVEGERLAEPWSQIVGAYVDQAHIRALAAVPLQLPASTGDAITDPGVGIVICERFESVAYTRAEQSFAMRLAGHTTQAVARAAELERLPLIGLSRLLKRLGWGGGVWGALRAWGIPVLVTVGLAVAGMWPIEFTVTAPGVLEPAEQREVFAPVDGVVREIRVQHGDLVNPGDLLLVLQNDELELEITRLSGELQTARRQYQTVRASRLDAVRPEKDPRVSAGQLAAEEERLKEVVRSLELQLEQRQRQREQLQVLSPSQGRLVTWDLERSLRARPVQRGQRLMTIANVAGGWQLQLQVADQDVGQVVAARRDGGELPITYRLASSPGQDRPATLVTIADWIDAHAADGPGVAMIARLPEGESIAVRPGSTVTAQFHLGQRPRAYVWFRDVWEFLRVKFWW